MDKTLNDLPKANQIFCITEEKSLREALNLLIQHNVYSLPVFSIDGIFRGVISLDSLISVIVQLFASKSESNNNSPSIKISHHKYSQKDLTDIAYEFNQKKIQTSNGKIVFFFCKIIKYIMKNQ